LFIAQMDRLGTKVRRDEWDFGVMDGKRLGVRIGYAHREQRIHLLWGRVDMEVISVNLDATDPRFPSLDECLDRLRNQVAAKRVDTAIHRSGEGVQ
jgi:hypothetical protein